MMPPHPLWLTYQLYEPPNCTLPEALDALANVLKHRPSAEFEPQYRVLCDLYAALSLQLGGITPPMLKVSAQSRRPVDSLRRQVHKMILVAVADELDAAGQQSAMRQVLALGRQAGIRASGGKTLTVTTVQRWRKKYRHSAMYKDLRSRLRRSERGVLPTAKLYLLPQPPALFWKLWQRAERQRRQRALKVPS
jgi:hypothetical protein